jgi:hypothetical protein
MQQTAVCPGLRAGSLPAVPGVPACRAFLGRVPSVAGASCRPGLASIAAVCPATATDCGGMLRLMQRTLQTLGALDGERIRLGGRAQHTYRGIPLRGQSGERGRHARGLVGHHVIVDGAPIAQ